MKKTFKQNRRHFLQKLGVIVGSAGALGLHGKLNLINSALAAPSDYKSLVCVFLHGGNDAWNMMVPNGSAQYQKYAAVRQGLAINRNDLLAQAGEAFGWHPSLLSIRELYGQGKLAVVKNIGTLFEPIQRDHYFDWLKGNRAVLNIPPDLFSHSHQQETFQTGRPAVPGVSFPGWGGRIADLLADGNSNPVLPPSFSISGSNFWQAGDQVQPYGVRPLFDEETGKLVIDDFYDFTGDDWPDWAQARSSAWEQIMALQYDNPLEEQAARSFLSTKGRADHVRDILGNTPSIKTTYDDQNPLASQLHGVAQLISVRESLGVQRQIFFVSLNGWDTHANHLGKHASKLSSLNHALKSFQDTLAELGLEESVTTFTASEFGRTLTSNGDGTNHAWASDCLVMGGAVGGGKVHGEPIEYSGQPQGEHWGQSLFGPSDVGSGRFIPKYSTDQYGATLAKWMGIDNNDLSAIFPNLNNFASKDLGFMR